MYLNNKTLDTPHVTRLSELAKRERISQTFPDDLDEFTYDLMEGIVGKENMTFERGMDIPNTGSNYNTRNQVINQYKKEFPAITFISEKTAQYIDSLNMQIGPLSIREIKEFYKAAGKELEANPTDENVAAFDKYKDVVDGLKQAQYSESKVKAQENALLDPSKSIVMEIEP